METDIDRYFIVVNVNNIADRYKTKNTSVMNLRKGYNLRVFNSVTMRRNMGGVEYERFGAQKTEQWPALKVLRRRDSSVIGHFAMCVVRDHATVINYNDTVTWAEGQVFGIASA